MENMEYNILVNLILTYWTSQWTNLNQTENRFEPVRPTHLHRNTIIRFPSTLPCCIFHLSSPIRIWALSVAVRRRRRSQSPFDVRRRNWFLLDFNWSSSSFFEFCGYFFLFRLWILGFYWVIAHRSAPPLSLSVLSP